MAELVQCKACGKEIAKGVKKCPNCGKDQRNWFMRHKFLSFVLAIIVLSVVGTMFGGGGEEQTSTGGNEQTGEAPPEEKVFGLNETVNADPAEITVTKMEEKSVIGDPDFLGKKASEGATLVAVQYKVKNVSDEPMGMFDYPTIKLVDEKGTEYDEDIEASGAYAAETGIDDSKVLSDLNPGITVTATDVYEVSKDAFASGKWYIQIGDAKVALK